VAFHGDTLSRKTLLRIWVGWFIATAAAYALWQLPDWDLTSSWTLPLGTALYWFQLPGMIVHGPHGGYGDWRDPAVVIPSTAIAYAVLTTAGYGLWHLAHRLLGRGDAT